MKASLPVRLSLQWSHHRMPVGKRPDLKVQQPMRSDFARMASNHAFPAPTDDLVRRVADEVANKRRSKPGFRDFNKLSYMWARLRLGFRTERVLARWLELHLLDFRDRARKQKRMLVRAHLELEAEVFFNKMARTILASIEKGKPQAHENRRGYITYLVPCPDDFSNKFCFITVDPPQKSRKYSTLVCIEQESRYKRRLRRGIHRSAREYRNTPPHDYH